MMTIWFYKGSDNWYGKAIRLLTSNDYSHCILVFSDGTSFSAGHVEGGTYFKDAQGTAEQISDTSDWYPIPLTWITAAQEKRVHLFCEQEHHSSYDYLGVLLGWINSNYQHTNKWFCSEICLHALLPYTKGVRDTWYSPGGLKQALLDARVWNARLTKDTDTSSEV